MTTFVHEGLPGRVRFGVGAIDQVGDEVDRLGAGRALLIAGGRLSARLTDLLGARIAGTIPGAVQHVPVAGAERARALADEVGADCVVCAGGGSATGLAKAVALTNGIPIVAIPTTYAGSEMTPVWGMTEAGRKTTGRDRRVLPATVLYDPALTVGMPAALTAASGLNALAHCVEACWAPGTNPLVAAQAEEATRLLAGGLRRSVAEPDGLDGRTDALLGAWLAGSALAAAGTALHHQLCHVLGGAYGLDHAGTHAALLPHTTAFVGAAAPAALDRVARALGTRAAGAPAAIHDLAADLGAPTSLAALGLREDDLGEAASLAAAHVAQRPRPAGAGDLQALLEAAWAGARPAAPGPGVAPAAEAGGAPPAASRPSRQATRGGA
jgi:alcohol dehydrogenase class IV